MRSKFSAIPSTTVVMRVGIACLKYMETPTKVRATPKKKFLDGT
jgi:hypothetical protein